MVTDKRSKKTIASKAQEHGLYRFEYVAIKNSNDVAIKNSKDVVDSQEMMDVGDINVNSLWHQW
jgi:hypothetical protein